MAKKLFTLACPRCHQAVSFKAVGQSTACRSCKFLLRIKDPDLLLEDYLSGKMEDLEFEQHPFSEIIDIGVCNDGLDLVMRRPGISGEMPAAQLPVEIGKGANTQIISLGFDPQEAFKDANPEKAKPSAPGMVKPKRASLRKSIERSRNVKAKSSSGLVVVLVLVIGVVLAAMIFLINDVG